MVGVGYLTMLVLLFVAVSTGARAETAAEDILIWGRLNDKCRSAGHSTEDATCRARDEMGKLLEANGLYFGEEGAPTYRSAWKVCRSIQTLPRYDVDADCAARDPGAYRNACLYKEQSS